MSAQLCCKLLFNILSYNFNLYILNIDVKNVNTSKVTSSATADKINIIAPKLAADDLCFHVSGVKFQTVYPIIYVNFKF